MSSAKLVIEQLTPSLETEVFEYKLVVGNAPGPKGEDPTVENIGALIAGALAKAAPADADSLGLSDSEDGNILKKITFAEIWTWIKGLADLVYQPLSTALSKITEAGGLPLWDGGAWPGGGGGGLWEVIESRVMTGNTVELFDVQANNEMLVFDSIYLATPAAISLSFSLNGTSYEARNIYTGVSQEQEAATVPFGDVNVSLAAITSLSFATKCRGFVELKELTGALTEPEYESESSFVDTFLASSRAQMGGYLRRAGVIDHVRINSSAMNSGTIHHLKRTF